MIYYKNDSGGATFSVDSITYTSALPVNDDVSTITKSVFEPFVGE